MVYPTGHGRRADTSPWLCGASVLAAALVIGHPARAQVPAGPQPGQGYGQTLDAQGRPYIHAIGPDAVSGYMAYTPVPVATTSTVVVPAAAQLRSKLYLLNPSGRPGVGGAAVDVWCSYGVPAVIGQGFILMGYGDRVTEDVSAVIDPRALSCIAPSAVTVTVGVVQQ